MGGRVTRISFGKALESTEHTVGKKYKRMNQYSIMQRVSMLTKISICAHLVLCLTVY